MFIGLISIHGREPISLSSSAVNCAYSFYLADLVLQSPSYHGRVFKETWFISMKIQVYYIMDGNQKGQFSFWDPLVKALGKEPPSIYIPYWLVKMFLPLYEYYCSYITKAPPLLTRFELAILAMDNTYSIERARKELGYEPIKCQMQEVEETKWVGKVILISGCRVL